MALLVLSCGGSETSVAGPTEGGPVGAGETAERVAADDDRMAAPDFELTDLAGNRVTMAGLRGKTVVIDFWATWCPPCIFQIPILNAIQAKHGDHGVVVIGVSVDAEGLEVVKPYAEENGVEYTILLGNEALARKFGAPGFPALAIVAPDGKVDSMHVGLIEEAELSAAIEKLQARGDRA
jgi:thiol-disulfide isomerase/thioredoxin